MSREMFAQLTALAESSGGIAMSRIASHGVEAVLCGSVPFALPCSVPRHGGARQAGVYSRGAATVSADERCGSVDADASIGDPGQGRRRDRNRSSLSLSRDLYARLSSFAGARDVPLTHVIAAGVDAILSGRLSIDPLLVEPRRASVRRTGRPPRAPATSVVTGAIDPAADAHPSPPSPPPQVSIAPDLRVAEDLDRMRRADVLRGMSATVGVRLPPELALDVQVQAQRLGTTPEVELDRAINRMVDDLTTTPWCRTCLESPEHCACKVRVFGARPSRTG